MGMLVGVQETWNWRQFGLAGAGGAAGGAMGGVWNRAFTGPLGRVNCACVQTAWSRAGLFAGHAAPGGVGGFLGDAADQGAGLLFGQEWDWNRSLTATALGTAGGFARATAQWYNRICFAAGTPLLTPAGHKMIEEFRVGDLLLSRSDADPAGPVEAKVVEEVFVNYGPLLHLHVAGQVIRTTAEHPFCVQEKGWTPAAHLQIGDKLSSHDGRWVAVEDLLDTGDWETVYNLRVADLHTYFVGSMEWDFSIWAHNAYKVNEGAPPKPESMSKAKGRTVGILSWEENGTAQWIKLTSGEKNAKAAGLGYTVKGDNAANYHHVEAQARKVMLERGLSEASLVINNPKGVCSNCSPRTHPNLLGDALPQNSVLSVFGYTRGKMTFLRDILGQL